ASRRATRRASSGWRRGPGTPARARRLAGREPAERPRPRTAKSDASQGAGTCRNLISAASRAVLTSAGGTTGGHRDEGAASHLAPIPAGSMADGIGLWQPFPDRCRLGGALRMAESAGAHAVHINVVDDVVVLPAVGHARRHEVEVEVVAHFPGDVVVRARRVTTHAQAADQNPIGVVQR